MVRRLLVVSLLMSAALPALAGPREDTLGGISRCAALPDDRAFLDCIYGAAQPMRARLGLAPAPVTQQRLVPPAPGSYAPPAAAPRAAMAPQPKPVGVVNSLLGNDPSANWMEAFSFDRHGLFTVTFSNGQIWRQDAGDAARAHWSGRPSDFSVKLATDASGRNGQLMVRGDTASYQVHKLR